jgi:hypothetical protein
VWWSAEDNGTLVDLVEVEEDNGGDNGIKDEPEDPSEDNYYFDTGDEDGGSDKGISVDYSVFYR